MTAKPGSISDQPGHLIDLSATCFDAANAVYPAEFAGKPTTTIQGQSLLPILKGRQRDGHEWLYFQFGDNRAIRRGDWKAVSARGGRWELYNIAEDRSELNDLASTKQDLVNELGELWDHVAKNVDHLPKQHRRTVKDNLKTFPASSMTQRAAGPKAKSTARGQQRGKRKNANDER